MDYYGEAFSQKFQKQSQFPGPGQYIKVKYTESGRQIGYKFQLITRQNQSNIIWLTKHYMDIRIDNTGDMAAESCWESSHNLKQSGLSKISSPKDNLEEYAGQTQIKT